MGFFFLSDFARIRDQRGHVILWVRAATGKLPYCQVR